MIKRVTEMFPQRYQKYYEDCLALKFDQKPDYSTLRNLLEQEFNQMNKQVDFSEIQLDWIIKSNSLDKDQILIVSHSREEA